MAVSGGGAAALDGAGHVLSLPWTKLLSCKLQDVTTYFCSDKQNFFSSQVWGYECDCWYILARVSQKIDDFTSSE